MRKLENALTLARQQNDAREKAEATLRESEEKYRLLFDNAGDAIFIHDEKGHILAANSQGLEGLGYTRAELMSMTVDQVDSPQESNHVQERIERLVRQGYHKFETVHRRKDGSLFPTDVSARQVIWEGAPAIMSICRDITARKQVENIIQARLRINEYAVEHTLDELLQNAIDELCALTDSPIGFFHFVEPDQRTLSLQAWSTRTLEEMCTAERKGHSYDIDLAGVWVDCVRQGAPIIHNDYASLPHRKGLPEGHAPVIREMVFPILRDQKMVAIIGVGNKAQDYTENDVAYASRLADMIWDITARKRAEKAEHAQRALAEALSNSAAALNSTLNFDDVLDRILDNVGRVVPHDTANIMLLGADGDTLSIECGRGYLERGEDNAEMQVSLATLPILTQAAQSGQPLAIPDTHANPDWHDFQATRWVCSYLTAPIRIRQHIAGFLNLDSATPGFFNSDHAERLQVFADQAAIAIENARLYEEVQKLALTDILTGIFNRTFFETELARLELSRDFPMSIVIADLDNMKITNDTLGHQAGDKLLKHTVQVLQAAFRAADIIARIGGDEFAVLLPNTDSMTAGQMLSRIRIKLDEHNAQHPELPIQLSLGASTAEHGKLMEAFSIADQRMYKDKALRKLNGKMPRSAVHSRAR